mmetsp:Transcript_85491/g.275764  ORF Transcript_85491/g.275764 Transcript_85491/m.275764 type:complete len:241 (+) Transcript_85491:1237-1959(+)
MGEAVVVFDFHAEDGPVPQRVHLEAELLPRSLALVLAPGRAPLGAGRVPDDRGLLLVVAVADDDEGVRLVPVVGLDEVNGTDLPDDEHPGVGHPALAIDGLDGLLLVDGPASAEAPVLNASRSQRLRQGLLPALVVLQEALGRVPASSLQQPALRLEAGVHQVLVAAPKQRLHQLGVAPLAGPSHGQQQLRGFLMAVISIATHTDTELLESRRGPVDGPLVHAAAILGALEALQGDLKIV